MTSAMSVSRIPVPVRNYDDATRHRTISAKTRLERLRDEFQRKLFFEKQAKLYDFYTQKERRNSKAAASRQIKSGEIGYGHYRNAEDFFGERESPLNRHRNGYASPRNNFPNVSGRSRRKPPLPPYTKRSAGRDRAHLLAPINPARPNQGSPKTREFHETGNVTLSPSPDYLGDTYTLQKLDLETVEQRKLVPRPPPIASRPKIMRPHVRNRTQQVQFHDETEAGGEGRFDEPKLERLKQEKLRQLNDDASDGSNHSLRKLGGRVVTSPGREGLPRKTRGASDFQKWQTDQNEERARRLQRLNEKSQNRAGPLFREELGKGDGKREPQKRQRELRVEDDDDEEDNDDEDNGDEDNGDEDNGNEDNDDGDNGIEDNEKEDEVWIQKQQVLQVHNRKESPARKTKVSDEEEEDVEDKRLKQKERELQELIQRQEKELQKLRLEKFEDHGEEKRRETQTKQRQTKVIPQKQQIPDAEKSQQKARRDIESPSVDKPSMETASSQKNSRNRPTRRTSVASLPPKQTWEPKIDPNNEETAFYLQKAISEGNRGADDVRLVPCPVCGRSFASNRLAKHEKICSKESRKTRKVFDEVAMRYKGTDFESHVKRRRNSIEEEEPIDEKKSHWRTKHQNFIDTIKYAKRVAKVQSEGGSLSNLPPPPVTVNPDYVQCPHCQRRFNKNAAERHIPWCKDTKSHQAPKPKPKGRRQ